CGAGGIAAFVARERGAEVLGIDHAAAAIALAQSQTAEGLRFRQADLNHLGALAAEAPFDAILASDALYWVADMAGTLKALRGLLSTGGRLAILMSHRAEAEADLAPEATRLGLVCAKLGLSHQVEDLTPELAAFWDRAIAAIEDLRPRFAAEGNSFIADWILAEAREGFLPHLARDRMRRYLYVMEA
ncbi:MAG: methyltransferase domain-containing protein, partial [Pseudomonadota bacterium]